MINWWIDVPLSRHPRTHEIMSGSFISNHKVKHAFDPPILFRRPLKVPRADYFTLHLCQPKTSASTYTCSWLIVMGFRVSYPIFALRNLCTTLVTSVPWFTKWPKCAGEDLIVGGMWGRPDCRSRAVRRREILEPPGLPHLQMANAAQQVFRGLGCRGHCSP